MTLTAAIVGTGTAAGFHADAYACHPDVRLIAACGRDEERVARFAAEWGIDGYTSFDELLDRHHPDVVSVATGEYDHVEPALAALARGCHVFCEKILAHSLSAGDEVLAAARRSGRIVGVNYNFRHLPVHLAIREALERGTLGPLALFAANTPAYLYPHMLDLIRFFFGDPLDVEATIIDDQAFRPALSPAPSSGRWDKATEMLYHPTVAVVATLRFPGSDGVATIASTAFVEPWMWTLWSFALYGRLDMVAVDHARPENLTRVAPLGGLAERLGALPPATLQESFRRSVADFVDAVIDRRPPVTTGEDALASMRLDARIVRAARGTAC